MMLSSDLERVVQTFLDCRSERNLARCNRDLRRARPDLRDLDELMASAARGGAFVRRLQVLVRYWGPGCLAQLDCFGKEPEAVLACSPAVPIPRTWSQAEIRALLWAGRRDVVAAASRQSLEFCELLLCAGAGGEPGDPEAALDCLHRAGVWVVWSGSAIALLDHRVTMRTIGHHLVIPNAGPHYVLWLQDRGCEVLTDPFTMSAVCLHWPVERVLDLLGRIRARGLRVAESGPVRCVLLRTGRPMGPYDQMSLDDAQSIVHELLALGACLDASVADVAAVSLEALEWLVGLGCAVDSRAVRTAALHRRWDAVHYLLDRGCAMDDCTRRLLVIQGQLAASTQSHAAAPRRRRGTGARADRVRGA